MLIIPITIIVHVIWPPPATVTDHFEQFQSSMLMGLLGMDLFYLLSNIFLISTGFGTC